MPIEVRSAGASLIAVLSLVSIGAHAFTYPRLPAHVDRAHEVMPRDWSIIDSASGDLNGDGMEDLAIVIEYQDTATHWRPGSMESFVEPRMLVVLLRNGAKGGHDLALSDTTFILRRDEGGQNSEAFGGIGIEGGSLIVQHEFVRSHFEHHFRLSNGRFVLVAAEFAGVHLDDFNAWSFDFMKNTGTMEWGLVGDEHEQRADLILHLDHLRTIEEIRMPGLWEVVPGCYI